MRRLLLACVLTGASALACAQVFECTNAAGAKEYSRFCPPGTVQQREVTKASDPSGESPPANPGAGASPKSLEVQDAQFRQRVLERQEADTKAAQERAQAEEFERNCLEARGELKSLLEGQRQIRFDPATGEKIEMGDAARAAEVERIRAEIALRCK